MCSYVHLYAMLLKAFPPVVTRVTIAWSVRLYVCRLSRSCTLLKTVGWNKMPFGGDTRVPSNIVLDRGPSALMGSRDLGVETPSLQRCLLSRSYFGRCSVE